MPRIGFFEKQEPLEIKTENGSEMICQCGLAKTFPFCDGTHLKTKDEESMKVYQYLNGERSVIGEIHDHNHGSCGCDDCHCDDDEKGSCNHDHE